ncbi:MAG: hypothetical protein ABI435_00205 [Pseudolysinimonas sp.]
MKHPVGSLNGIRAHVAALSTLALVVGVALLLAAGAFAAVEGRLGTGLLAGGLAVGLTGLGIEARRLHRRMARLAALEEVDRFALQAIAGDSDRQSRMLERLAGSTERSLRALLTSRLLGETPDPEGSVDPGVLAGILAFAPRQVIVVASDSVVEAYTSTLTGLSPGTAVLSLPAANHVGAFLDRLAARRRTTGGPVPLFAAIGYAQVHATVWGDTALHVFERFDVEEFLVLAPPGSHGVADDPPRTRRVHVTPLGSIGLLVRRANSADQS